MFEKLSDNLNLLMAEVRISADELGRRTGLTSGTIKKIRNRYNPNPTLTTLLPLAKYFAVTLDQLVGNEPLPEERTKGTYQVNLETLRHIPLLSWDEATTWPSTNKQLHSTITTEHNYSETAFALIVEEDGWENLAKGTALLIDPILKADHRDFVIVLKKGQQTPTLKQAFYDEGQLYLKPVIQGYSIIKFTQEHRLLGVVVEYKKHLKKTEKS
jgi:SOS-response transcriptional repressor LexA